MKKLLIISPYFPPVNAADMQRVRMSLPYFVDNGWEAEVVMVDEKYTDLGMDLLLVQSLPVGVRIHKVKAFKKEYTSKLGLGSIALRSLWFYRQKVNAILKAKKFDLIYFSTTQFPVCVLGPYWKKKHGIPYVIDIQDPWFSTYYVDKPKAQRPPKYWFSYRLNKYMEPLAVNNAAGLISVSDAYVYDLQLRYPAIKAVPHCTITFGAFDPDLKIAAANKGRFENVLDPHYKNVVYIGRGGTDMYDAIRPLFSALRQGIAEGNPNLRLLKFYFIGTSYAAPGKGTATVMPLAREFGLESQVTEITDRISYYHTLVTLCEADALFIPGSDDPKYTASKIYPYLLTQKPLLAIFNKASSVIGIMKEYGVKHIYDYATVTSLQINNFLSAQLNSEVKSPCYNQDAIKKYSAQQMTVKQCQLFNQVVSEKN